MKYLNITQWNKKVGYWLATIPASAAHTIGTIDGVKYFTTKRAYFCDTKKGNKLRYQTMSTVNASYDILVDIYVEILPGMYTRYLNATEDNISDMLARAAKAVKTAAPTFDAETYRKNLVELN